MTPALAVPAAIFRAAEDSSASHVLDGAGSYGDVTSEVKSTAERLLFQETANSAAEPKTEESGMTDADVADAGAREDGVLNVNSGQDDTGQGVPSGDMYKQYVRIYPQENWENISPEERGYSSRKIREFDRYFNRERPFTHFMVVVGGKVIYSKGDLSENVIIASCRKSLLSMLYGKYVEDGTINLDSTLGELRISDKRGLRSIEKKAKVRHLLTARSGVYHPASNSGDDSDLAPRRGSVIPGTFFLYNNWDFNCAGTIFEKLTGQNIYEAFQTDIAEKIGLQDYDWRAQQKTGDRKRSIHPAYHFSISTRDMARIGYLMLRKGKWDNNQQVISEAWVKLTTSPLVENPPPRYGNPKRKPENYSYMWWVFHSREPAWIFSGSYSACGTGGQYITVLPQLDMVIACKDSKKKMNASKLRELIRRLANCRQ